MAAAAGLSRNESVSPPGEMVQARGSLLMTTGSAPRAEVPAAKAAATSVTMR
jgi:hypothetical protein